MIPILSGPRLRLRAPTLADYDDYAAILGADQGHMGGPFSPKDIWADFCNYMAGWMLQGLGLWTIERHDGLRLGFINLALAWGDEEPELGWMILPAHRGNGYATEAARLARDWGLAILPSMVSYADPDNTASHKVAQCLGAARDLVEEERIAHWDPEPPYVWRHKRRAQT